MPQEPLLPKIWTILDHALLGTGFGIVSGYAHGVAEAYAYDLFRSKTLVNILRDVLCISAISTAIFGVIAVFVPMIFRSTKERLNIESYVILGFITGVIVLILSEIYYVSQGRVYNVEPLTYFTLEAVAAGMGGAGVFAAVAVLRNWMRRRYRPA